MIQDAIDQADPDDTIVINSGQYQESLTLNKPVSLTGVISLSTMVRAQAGQRVLTVTGGIIDKDVRIAGLALIQGQIAARQVCPTNCGGGNLLTNSAAPTIDDLYFGNNTAHNGGAIYAEVGSPVQVYNSVFAGNLAVLSGGAICTNGTAFLTGTQIMHNQAQLIGVVCMPTLV